VPVAPERQQFLDVHQRGEQPERKLQHRPVAIDDDEQRGLHRRARHLPGRRAGGRREDRAELLERAFDAGGFGLAVLRAQRGIRAHARGVLLEHLLHRLAVFEREVVVGPVHERRARQPAIELVDQLRPALGARDAGLVGRGERLVERLAGVVDPRLERQAEPDFDQAKLHRLEARGRKQEVAEIEEVERRHRLQHLELLDQQLEDFDDAIEPVHDAAEIFVFHDLAAEIGLNTVELVQDLLEPQLVGLVHDDEQHFVVRRPAAPRALGLLRAEKLVELEIVGVVGFAFGRGCGHRGTSRIRPTMPDLPHAVARCEPHARFNAPPSSTDRRSTKALAVTKCRLLYRSAILAPLPLRPARRPNAFSTRRLESVSPSWPISRMHLASRSRVEAAWDFSVSELPDAFNFRHAVS
jgi:hypothetical protein